MPQPSVTALCVALLLPQLSAFQCYKNEMGGPDSKLTCDKFCIATADDRKDCGDDECMKSGISSDFFGKFYCCKKDLCNALHPDKVDASMDIFNDEKAGDGDKTDNAGALKCWYRPFGDDQTSLVEPKEQTCAQNQRWCMMQVFPVPGTKKPSTTHKKGCEGGKQCKIVADTVNTLGFRTHCCNKHFCNNVDPLSNDKDSGASGNGAKSDGGTSGNGVKTGSGASDGGAETGRDARGNGAKSGKGSKGGNAKSSNGGKATSAAMTTTGAVDYPWRQLLTAFAIATGAINDKR